MSTTDSTTDSNADGHFLYGPSSLESVLLCSARPAAIMRYLPRDFDSNSVHAETGTIAHRYAEQALKGLIADDRIPDEITVTVNGQTLHSTGTRAPILVYVNHCRTLANRWKVLNQWVELSLPLFYAPRGSGTLDFGLCVQDPNAPEGIRWIFNDLKFGEGKMVSPVENPQQMAYALSAIELLSLDAPHPDAPVDIWITQPRYRGADGEHGEPELWETTYGALAKWKRDGVMPLATAVERSLDANRKFAHDGRTPAIFETGVKFEPGDACFFCPAKHACTARQKVLNVLSDEAGGPGALRPVFEAINDDESSADERLIAIFKATSTIQAILKSTAATLYARSMQGEKLPGLKLVDGREGNRTWVSQEEAIAALEALGVPEDKRYISEPIGPATAEALAAEQVPEDQRKRGYKKQIAERVSAATKRSPGKPSLVPAEDKRPELDLSAGGVQFEPITDEETEID